VLEFCGPIVKDSISRADTINIIVRNAFTFPRLDNRDASVEPPNTPKHIIAVLLKGYVSIWNEASNTNAKILIMKSKN